MLGGPGGPAKTNWSVTKSGDLKASLEENQPSRSPHCVLGPHWSVSQVLFLHMGLTSSNRVVFQDWHQHCTSQSWGTTPRLHAQPH